MELIQNRDIGGTFQEIVNHEIPLSSKVVNSPINSELCYVSMETIWKIQEALHININVDFKDIDVDLMIWTELA